MNPSYIIYLNDAEQGPYQWNDLEMMESIGELSDDTSVRLDAHDIWKPWSKFKEERLGMKARKDAYEASHSPRDLMRRPPGIPVKGLSSRSRVAFILFGLFFGTLGVHNFYAGYTARGIAQLLITVLLAFILIGPMISAVWALIDIIAVREDSDGLPFAS